METLLEKHKSLFQLFSVLPLGQMIAMLLAGEMYRKNYPPQAYIHLTQDPVVFYIGLGIGGVGLFTWILLIVHAYKNPLFHTPLKVLWIGSLFLFRELAMPVYFFRFVLNPVPELDTKNEMTQTLLWIGIFFVGSLMVAVYYLQYLAPYLAGEALKA